MASSMIKRLMSKSFSDKYLQKISEEQLRDLAEQANQQPKKDRSYRNSGRLEVYRGSFDTGEPEKAILVDPLRVFAEATLPQMGIPLQSGIIEALLKREGTIDPEVVRRKFALKPEPVIVAEHFYGKHKHEIVDGNHTYMAFAAAFHIGQSEFALPEGLSPSVPGYIVPKKIWRDFLAVEHHRLGYLPRDGRAIARRLKGIEHDLPFDFAVLGKAGTARKRRWKGRP